MPDAIEKVAELEGKVTELETQIEGMVKQLQEAAGDDPDLAKALELQGQIDELVGTTQELTTNLAKVQEERDNVIALLDVIAKMTPDEQAYCADMEPAQKAEFMAKPKEERDQEMGKRAKDDEFIKIGDTIIRKSVVGEAQFAVIKSQQDEITKNREELAKERDKRELAELTKRADEEYAHVPGSSEERALILRAVGKMDEKLRKSFEAVLTQSEKLAKTAFERVGHGGGSSPLDSAIEKQAKDFKTKLDKARVDFPKLSGQQVMAKVRKDNPELFNAYQQVGQQAGENGSAQ